MNLFGYKLCLLASMSCCLLMSGCTLSQGDGDSEKINKTVSSLPPTHVFYSAEASKEEMKAAEELAGYLKKMTGSPVKCSQSLPGKVLKNCVLVGKIAVEKEVVKQSKLNDLKREGYIVRVDPVKNIIGLSGRTKWGTVQGCYRLLEDLGVRFLTSDTEFIPSCKMLQLNYTHKTDAPFFDLRFIGTIRQGGNTALLGDPRKLVAQSEKKYFINLYKDHTQGFLLPTYKYLNQHPEFYARNRENAVTFKNRRSFLGNQAVETEHYANWVWLCMSNPQAREAAARRLLWWMEQQPDCYFFSVMGGDAEWNCECDSCRAAGNLSDNLIDFANYLGDKVKEKNPDALLLVFAYSRTLEAPKKYAANDNVVILFCPYMPPYFKSSVHSFISSPYNLLGGKAFDKWNAKNSGQMGAFDYNMSFYTPFLDKMIVQLKEYAARKMRGVWYCGTASLMPELFVYVNSRLLWNPSLDADGLIRDFCEKYYGGAGEYMYQLAEALREQLRKPNTALSPNVGVLRNRAYYSKRFCGKVLALLKAAEKNAGDKVCLKKIQEVHRRILENILFAWKGIDRDATEEDQKLFAQRLRDFLLLSIARDGIDKNMQKFLWQTAHLKISSSWRKDKILRSLIDSPYEAFRKYHVKWENLQQSVTGGWRIPLDAFGGMRGPIPYRWLCELKMANIIYGSYTAFHEMKGSVFLRQTIHKPCRLIIEGQDHDKNLPAALIRIKVNNHTLFEGRNRFRKHGWSVCEYKIPAGVLRKGENVIAVENLEATDNTVARWFAISEVKIVD